MMMTLLGLNFHPALFFMGLLGWLLQSLFKIKAMKTKAVKANVEFVWHEYFTNDAVGHLITLLSIIIADFAFDEVLRIAPSVADYVLFFFVTIGFTNGAVISYILEFISSKTTNAKLNSAIDYKTTKSDEIDGTLGKPTPK